MGMSEVTQREVARLRLWDAEKGLGKYTVYKNDPRTGQQDYKVEYKVAVNQDAVFVFVLGKGTTTAPEATKRAIKSASRDPRSGRPRVVVEAPAELRLESSWPAGRAKQPTQISFSIMATCSAVNSTGSEAAFSSSRRSLSYLLPKPCLMRMFWIVGELTLTP